jgi:hypothetical protein
MTTNTPTHDCPGCGFNIDEATLHCARCLQGLRLRARFGDPADRAEALGYLALEERDLLHIEYVEVPALVS